MRGLILEGGGAKGAYQAGAIKALNKRGIYFDGAAGTSIGAINAAYYVNKRCDKMYKLWLDTDSEELFGFEGNVVDEITSGNFNKENIKKSFETIIKTVKNNGIETSGIRKILNKSLNENQIRRSDIDFGLVTFDISDMKPIEIYKSEIPEGKFIDYLLASAYLPLFKHEKIIDDKYYLDGGVYARCPIEMFLNKDYDEIYVIKAWKSKLKYKAKKGVKVHIITPSEDLRSIFIFTPKVSKYRMNLGYYDTMKYLDKLDSKKYYFKPYSDDYYTHLFDTTTLKRMIKKYSSTLIKKSNKEFILSIIEKVCEELKINRFTIQNTPYLITKLKYKMVSNKKSVYYDFIKQIKVDFE